jgi:hypothetical protein
MTIALQNAKGPDEAATSVQAKVHPSTSLQDKKMNEQSNTTAHSRAPARPLELQLLDIADHVDRMAAFADAIEMATTAIGDKHQRNAMSTACDVLTGLIEDLQGFVCEAREALA